MSVFLRMISDMNCNAILGCLTILFVGSNCLPTDSSSMEDIKANLSSLWTEVNSLRQDLQAHINPGRLENPLQEKQEAGDDHQYFAAETSYHDHPSHHTHALDSHHHHHHHHGHHRHDSAHHHHQGQSEDHHGEKSHLHQHHHEHHGHHHKHKGDLEEHDHDQHHHEDSHGHEDQQKEHDPPRGEGDSEELPEPDPQEEGQESQLSQVQQKEEDSNVEEQSPADVDDSKDHEHHGHGHHHGHHHTHHDHHHGHSGHPYHSHDHHHGHYDHHHHHPRDSCHHYHHHQPHDHHEQLEAYCHLQPNVENKDSKVEGRIVIRQKVNDSQGPVTFEISIKGFPKEAEGKSKHGFHIHKNPVLFNKCSTAGPHFNPESLTHGAPVDTVRHVGDLGNIEVNQDGEFIDQKIIDSKAQLVNGTSNIIGRSIVVHALEDDLGQGGDEGSLATGNAGARLACCTITDKDAKPPEQKVFKETRIRFNG